MTSLPMNSAPGRCSTRLRKRNAPGSRGSRHEKEERREKVEDLLPSPPACMARIERRRDPGFLYLAVRIPSFPPGERGVQFCHAVVSRLLPSPFFPLASHLSRPLWQTCLAATQALGE